MTAESPSKPRKAAKPIAPRTGNNNGLMVVLIVTQFMVILFLGAHSFRLRVQPLDVSYADWIAVILTGVGLIISVLAVFLGVLAFIGWQTFDNRVTQRVNEVLSDGELLVDCLEKEWGINGRLRKPLQDAVERVSYDIPGGQGGQSSDEQS